LLHQVGTSRHFQEGSPNLIFGARVSVAGVGDVVVGVSIIIQGGKLKVVN